MWENVINKKKITTNKPTILRYLLLSVKNTNVSADF